jgi:hypothetical protein
VAGIADPSKVLRSRLGGEITHNLTDTKGGFGGRRDRVSIDEIEAEGAGSFPNKDVLSLLEVNANVDLGLDLAAPAQSPAGVEVEGPGHRSSGDQDGGPRRSRCCSGRG